MKKIALIFISSFLILLILPIIYASEVKFNIAEFITQYYIFIFNAFLILGAGIWVNKKVSSLEEKINIKNQKKLAIDHSRLLLDRILKDDIGDIKKNILVFNSLSQNFIPMDDKMKVFLESLNEYNIEEKKVNPIYKSTILFLKNYEEKLR